MTHAHPTFPRRLLGAAAACTLVAAGLVASTASPSAAADWSTFTKVCVVKDARIKENSGMSRSTYARPVMFAHNDSGGGAQFFVLGTRCGVRAVFDVPGAPAKDWEDMAAGPGHTLWFGDIGGSRTQVNVVRVKEPRKLKSRDLAHTSFTLAYPDGAHNAEAMMVRPGSGRLFVITKSKSGGAIYRAPRSLSPSGVNDLVKVADAHSGLSGADYSRDGKHFVLRGYERAFVFTSLDDTDPTVIDLPDAHTFGEAGMFTRSGALVFGAEGLKQWLWKAQP